LIGFPESVVPDLVHHDEIGFGDFAANIGAEIAVHRLPDRVVIGERKADAVDRRGRNQRGEDQPRKREELNAARADLAQHIGVGAKLIVWKDLQIEAAVGFGLDRRRHLLGARVHGMRIGQIVGIFVGKFGRLRARDKRRANATQYR